MEPKGENQTAAEGFVITELNRNDAVIEEMRQREITAVLLDGCVLLQNRGWVLTDEKLLIDGLLPSNTDSTQDHCLPERKSSIS